MSESCFFIGISSMGVSLVLPFVNDGLTHPVDLFGVRMFTLFQVHVFKHLAPACSLVELLGLLNDLLFVFKIGLFTLLEFLFLFFKKLFDLGSASFLAGKFLLILFVLQLST